MTTASSLIRASIAALPERFRDHPWTARDATGTGWPDGELLAGGSFVGYPDKRAGAYIALMDPTVGAALADLLDEFRRHDNAGPRCHHPDECWESVAEQVEALEAALLRHAQPPPGGSP